MDKQIEVFKALSDYNRLTIIDMLSCGELCACDIIEGLNLTQPTVSHHMKILEHAGLVRSKKEGKWTKYHLNIDNFNAIGAFINTLSSDKEQCICKGLQKTSCKAEK